MACSLPALMQFIPFFFCVAMCMLQVRALQAVLETSGSAFPEAMMGRRESSERYLPKIIIEKSQKIDSIGNRKKTKNIGTVLGFAILAPLEKSSNSIENFNIFSNIKKKNCESSPLFSSIFLEKTLIFKILWIHKCNFKILWIHKILIPKIVDPQNLKSRIRDFCGSTSWQVEKLWIHKSDFQIL